MPLRGGKRLEWLDHLEYVVMADTVATLDRLRAEHPDVCVCCLGTLAFGLVEYLSARVRDGVELGLAAHGVFLETGDAA